MAMTAEREFGEFFRTATGREPLGYQTRLAIGEALPALIDVPTGLGKTAAAVLAWLWRRRSAAAEVIRATPRRLVYCLPMRVLVEQTRVSVSTWLENLRLYAEDPAALTVAEDGRPPIAVHVLMGGEDAGDWVLYPERDAILIGTQDMLLSRALNRGYAAGRGRWPMEFGLLNNDCLWVFDEVQLMGSGLATSLQLQAWRESLRLRAAKNSFPREAANPVFGPTRSLWMSATTAKHWLEKAVDWRPNVDEAWASRERLLDEEKKEGHVGKLFAISKCIAPDRIAVLQATEKPESKAATEHYLAAVTQQIQQKRAPDGVTLVIVNTVERATRLYELLQDQGPDVHLIHSRFRPHERQRWNAILDKDNKTPRLIISTQVVEAGVDFSARVLFTELAPWASLVQRFGRCARYPGEEGTIYWMDLEGDEGARPYEGEELKEAHKQLVKLGDAGLKSLTTLSESLDSTTKEALCPYEPKFVPREKDLFELFDTTPDLTGADIDISRFIRDGQELDVMVYWRDVMGEPGKGHRPLRDELCPVAFYTFKQQLRALRKHGRIWRRHYRNGWEAIDGGNTETIYPGQVFLLERSCGGYSEKRGWTGNPDNRVAWVETQPSPQPESEEVEESDDQCESHWLTIAAHCGNVCRRLEETSLRDAEIVDAIGAPAKKVLFLAARWHDRGKAHPAFQAKLKEEELRSPTAKERLGDEPAAKAPPNAWWPPRSKLMRPGFRHELASALAALETLWVARPDHAAFAWPEGLRQSICERPPASWRDAPEYKALTDELAGLTSDDIDLFVYLVASHHGKVRMSLRSSPDDSKTDVPDPCPADTRQARGVRDDDDVPACRLPDPDGRSSLHAPAVTLHLDPMELGLSDRYGPSWRERTQGLLETLGPFRLGYLEAVLRAADWRASQKERQQRVTDHGEGHVREDSEGYAAEREGLREFVRRWAEAGPVLEEQRYAELQELDDERARQITLDLFKLWRPRTMDEMGGELVEAQQVFIKAARQEAARKLRA
jgi:CRISPR-associated endonuclease/helicase Cas3